MFRASESCSHPVDCCAQRTVKVSPSMMPMTVQSSKAVITSILSDLFLAALEHTAFSSEKLNGSAHGGGH